MKTYDVYLRSRLTEIDVIITELIQRDVLLMYNKLFLFCDPMEIWITKNIAADTVTELRVDIDEICEYVHETLNSQLSLIVNSDAVHKVFNEIENEIYLYINKAEIIVGKCVSSENKLEILVNPLDYYIGHSLGNAFTVMNLLLKPLEFLKTGHEQFGNILISMLSVDFASNKIADFNEVKNYIQIAPTNIYYQCRVAGETVTQLYPEPIKNPILKKVLSDVDIITYLDAAIDSDMILFANIEPENILHLIAEMETEATKYLEIDLKTLLKCEARAGLKRYRLLDEMDDLTLDDFDRMDLGDVDFIIIVE